MKKTIKYVFTVAAIVVAASCAEKIDNIHDGGDTSKEEVVVPDTPAPAPVNLVEMTLTASTEGNTSDESETESAQVKSSYKNRLVLWEESDEITVFSVGSEISKNAFEVTALSEDKVSASFTGLADENASAYYAVYPHSELNSYDNGSFVATISTEQIGVADGFASESNVAVAAFEKNATSTFEFKNISALIAFKFETEQDAINTKYVTLKAKKSDDANPEFWGLTGGVSFTLDEKNFPVVSEGTVDHVTLVAPEGGFKSGKNYFIPVAPVGNCTGLQVIFTDKEDKTFVCENNTDFVLERNTLFNCNSVPRPYLPEEITIEIDFKNGWPFTTDCVAEADQKAAGESYKYNYVYGPENSMTYPLTFAISYGGLSTDKSYAHVDAALCFYSNSSTASNSTAVIMLPRVAGRYLSNVKAVHCTASFYKRFIIQEGFKSVGASVTPSWNTTSKEFNFSFPVKDDNGNVVIEPNMIQTYSLRMRDCSMKVEKIVLTYTRTKPE